MGIRRIAVVCAVVVLSGCSAAEEGGETANNSSSFDTVTLGLDAMVAAVDVVASASMVAADEYDSEGTFHLQFEDVVAQWHNAKNVFSDGSEATVPSPPSSLAAVSHVQDFAGIDLPEEVVVLLSYDALAPSPWSANYVLRDSGEPYPGNSSRLLPANEELQTLFADAEDDAAGRVELLVEYVSEQIGLQEARNRGEALPAAPRTRALEKALAAPAPPDPLTAWRSKPAELRSLDHRDLPPGHGLKFDHVRVVLTADAALAEGHAGVGLLNDSGVVRVQAIQPETPDIPIDLRVVNGESLEVVLYDQSASAVARRLGSLTFFDLKVPFATRIEVRDDGITTSRLSRHQYENFQLDFKESAMAGRS